MMEIKTEEYLKSKIRTVPNFPKKGIMLKDITTLIQDPEALKTVILEMKKRCSDKKIDIIVGIESRGFIFGSILAHELGVGFVPVRKRGKLPASKMAVEYEKEYGMDAVEIHKDSIRKGENVLIVDDLLATGGTAVATTKLIEKTGGSIIGLLFLIELSFLNGRKKLDKYNIYSMVKYDKD